MTDPAPEPFSDSRRAEETFRLEPAPTWVGRAAIPWETPAAPDDHVVALLAHTQWAPEHFLRHERSVRRLLSREAVQQLSQVEVEWDPAVETLIIHELSLWRDGKKRSFAERSRFLLRQREGSFEQQLVHGRMSAIALLDDVRAGDAVEFEFSILSQARLPGERFDALYASERTVTTGRWVVSIILPTGSPFQWWRSDPSIEVAETHTSDGAGVVRTFEGKQETPLLLESGIPPWLIPYRHFQITGYHSWAEVGKCLSDAWDSVPRDRDALRQFAEELSREAATLEEKACAMIDWVQDHVRYLGMVGGAGGLRPQSPDRVLARRYGDCKDKTLLLCSLLNELGIAAEPVLVNTVHRHIIGSLLPGLGSFDHVITSFVIGDRKGFVDATTAGDGGGAFDRCLIPYGLGLPIRPGVDQLIEIPDQTDDRSSLLVTEDLHLDPGDAISHLDWRIEGVGSDANHLRARLRAVGGETFAKAEAENLRQTFPTARHAGPAKWIDDKYANRVIVWGRAAFADWGANGKSGRKAFQYKPRWIYHALSTPTLAEKRSHPFHLVFPAIIRHEIRIHQPRHGFSQKIRLHADNPFFHTTTSIRKASSSLIEAVYAYRIHTGILEPAHVETYWRHLDDVVSNQLGLTLSLRGKTLGNRALPDALDTLLPPRDETGIEIPRVDSAAAGNITEWLVKPAAQGRSFGGGASAATIAVIAVFAFGTLSQLLDNVTKKTGPTAPGSRPAAVTRLTQANLAYATWEKHFFAQEPETIPALAELCQVAPDEPRTRYAAAMTAFAEGRVDDAEGELNHLPIDSGFGIKARILRGQIALARNDLDSAREITREVITGAQADPLAWMLAALVAEADGALPLAVERIGEAVKLAPRNFLVCKTQLSLLSALPDATAAVTACRRGIAEFPEHSLFAEWMADHLLAIGQPAEAIATARRAVGISRSEARSRIVLARVLAASPEARDRNESADLYAALLREAGGTPGALRTLASTALLAGDDTWAIDLLTRAATSSPDAETLANLALVLIVAGRPDEAKPHLDRALLLAPRSAEVRRVSLILADQTGDSSLRARVEKLAVP